jgi:hypothetical protein
MVTSSRSRRLARRRSSNALSRSVPNCSSDYTSPPPSPSPMCVLPASLCPFPSGLTMTLQSCSVDIIFTHRSMASSLSACLSPSRPLPSRPLAPANYLPPATPLALPTPSIYLHFYFPRPLPPAVTPSPSPSLPPSSSLYLSPSLYFTPLEQAMEKSIQLGEKGMERVPSIMETFSDARK